MFAMEKLLSGFDVRVEAFEVCDVRGGWCLDLAPANELALHYVLAGQGTLRLGESTLLPLEPATVVVVNAGRTRKPPTSLQRNACREPAASSQLPTSVEPSAESAWLQADPGGTPGRPSA